MRRIALIIILLQALIFPSNAQNDVRLMLDADFSSKIIIEHAPADANAGERALYEVYKQLTGSDFYDPPNYMFFRQAVDTLGFVPAVFATLDRVLRDSKIGTATLKLDPDDPVKHEGPEAYDPQRVAVAQRPLVRGAATSILAAAPLRPRELEGSAPRSKKCCCDSSNAAPLTQSPADCATATRWVSKDIDFVDYLIDNELKPDARALLFQDYHPSDTLTYLRGWTLYQLKELDTASGFLKAVPSTSPFYEKSLFYSTAVSAHLGDYSSPVGPLEAYSGRYSELKDVQLAGLALLRDDPAAYKQAAASFGYSDFTIADAEKKLNDIYVYRYETKAKSPLLAAAASAVVPGLGKVYAGNLGEGIASFLLVGALGAITAEHWLKDGPQNWKTIVPGIMCAGLYIGNIYGSYMSVSIVNNDIRNAQNTTVLYNIHIPLRAVFK